MVRYIFVLLLISPFYAGKISKKKEIVLKDGTPIVLYPDKTWEYKENVAMTSKRDVLKLHSGAIYQGDYISKDDKTLLFHVDNMPKPQKILLSLVNSLTLSDGTEVFEGSKLDFEKELNRLNTKDEKPTPKKESYLAAEPIIFSKVIQCEGNSKTDIFISVNDWFASHYNSANDVIQMADKDGGIIIGNGRFEYFSPKPVMWASFNGWIKYTIKVYMKESRYKVELRTFIHEKKLGEDHNIEFGIITDVENISEKGFIKETKNMVWKDIKQKISNKSDAIFYSLNEHTKRQSAEKSQDDW